MEKVKKLIRFYQIKYPGRRLREDGLKRFLDFCKQGEEAWCQQNLSSYDFYHLNLEDEKRRRRRFESIQAIRRKSLHEFDFIEFSHDEKKNGWNWKEFPKMKKKNLKWQKLIVLFVI